MLSTVVSRNIKALRVQKGMTQTELANLIGVRYGAINRWENCHAEPSFEALDKIAEALGVHYLQLLTENGSENVSVPRRLWGIVTGFYNGFRGAMPSLEPIPEELLGKLSTSGGSFTDCERVYSLTEDSIPEIDFRDMVQSYDGAISFSAALNF